MRSNIQVPSIITIVNTTQEPLESIVRQRKSSKISNKNEKGDVIEARQRLYQTPAGRYVHMRESILEDELLQLAERCKQLKNELDQERNNVELLKGSISSSDVRLEQLRNEQQVRLLKSQIMQSSILQFVVFIKSFSLFFASIKL